ncbi:MAG: MgtC/SapB family protein [Patescibacteria group bacterium]|jgi:putative Mg2+ transporter-C (MgtC) family protein
MLTSTLLFRLLLAAILGALIGWERQKLAEKPAGTKTYALVTVGSALFTLISQFGFLGRTVDPSHVAGQIVIGIGFLGAGMILTHGGKIAGLTTAAGLWVAAGIGMAIGVGWTEVAIVLALCIFASFFWSDGSDLIKPKVRAILAKLLKPRTENNKQNDI